MSEKAIRIGASGKRHKGRETCPNCKKDSLIKATTGNPAIYVKYCRSCGVQIYGAKLW